MIVSLLLLAAHAEEPRALSIEDALRQAAGSSEAIRIAEAQVGQAEADKITARSAYLPSVAASVTYQRTFETEFDDLFSGFSAPPTGVPTTGTPTTGTPTTDTTGTPTTGTPSTPTGDESSSGGGGLPFGQPNTWRAGFTVQQGIYGGGRAGALNKIAGAGGRSAEVGLEAARAQVALDTASAYFDAALADRLLEIATASLAQAEAALRQTELGQGVGRQPEFDLLRAKVVVDNQRVAVINARRQRDLAFQRLNQLLQLPVDTPLALTSSIEGTDVSDLARQIVGPVLEDTPRAPVRQLTELAEISRTSVALARADALPSLGASANVGWVAYPDGVLPFQDTSWYSSINATVALSVPLFNGGRLWGAYQKAVDAAAASAFQLQQTTELAELDARSARSGLEAAEAQWAATDGVVEQAQRAYGIAELRFDEGVSTQLELSDARLQLEQALVNRARSARDLAVARIRVSLLASLPLSTPF